MQADSASFLLQVKQYLLYSWMEVMTIHKVSSPTSKHCNQSQKPEEETQCAAADPGNNVVCTSIQRDACACSVNAQTNW